MTANQPDLGPDALDRLLGDLGKEYKAQLVLLRRIHGALEGVADVAGRVEELRSRTLELLEGAVGDDNEIINEEIGDALDWLQGDFLDDLSNLDDAQEFCGAYIEQIEDLQSQLSGIVANTPKRSFYARDDDDD